MSLREPVTVYHAPSDRAAELCRELLGQSGIEAYVMDQSSEPIAEAVYVKNYQAEVWVSRADAEKASEILRRLAADAGDPMAPDQAQTNLVQAACEECGAVSTFDSELHGTVQDCPACGKFMDVGADNEGADWGDPDDESSSPDHEEVREPNG